MSAILIIEDDAITQDKIAMTIHNLDSSIKIMKAQNGEEALQIAKNIEVDIFIIDIGLPDINGIDLAKEIRKDYPYNPIIIESSMGGDRYQNKIHDQIENLAFLKKPYSNEKLIAKVHFALKIIENSNYTKIKIKKSNVLILIKIDEIIYIEKKKSKKAVVITQYNMQKKCIVKEEFNRITLNSLLEMLENKNSLLRCHRSYIVNPKMIEKLNYANDTVTLKYTEVEIPIGKTYKNKVAILV